jgi:CheY-like chemotaxis protein/anti-sigma regulatory factor (Ser/Thr protein kinase)
LSKKKEPRILVVDDHPINIKLLQLKLERQGMHVSVAYNGRECLEIVEEANPDLILLDIMMPEMDGIEVCQRLKSNSATKTIPIIFITAKASKEGKLEGLDAGAVDYITKPVDLDETLARIHTQLRLQEMFHENIRLQERLGDARKAAAVGAITKGITHNLNNLLGVVVGYLDLLKNGQDSPDMVKRSVGLIDKSITRMVDIVGQLGTIANNERHELAVISVPELIESSIVRFKEEYKVDAKVLIDSLLEDDIRISANAETFEIVLGKLLINAWESYDKDTPPTDRRISLQASVEDKSGSDMLHLKVADKGEGIDLKVLDTLFEPFITTKTSVGRGMGLTIARHTMRNLKGDIHLQGNADNGVTAMLTYPL